MATNRPTRNFHVNWLNDVLCTIYFVTSGFCTVRVPCVKHLKNDIVIVLVYVTRFCNCLHFIAVRTVNLKLQASGDRLL